MDQYLLIPFLGEWTSIYQLFWCSPGVQGFDTLPYNYCFKPVCFTCPSGWDTGYSSKTSWTFRFFGYKTVLQISLVALGWSTNNHPGLPDACFLGRDGWRRRKKQDIGMVMRVMKEDLSNFKGPWWCEVSSWGYQTALHYLGTIGHNLETEQDSHHKFQRIIPSPCGKRRLLAQGDWIQVSIATCKRWIHCFMQIDAAQWLLVDWLSVWFCDSVSCGWCSPTWDSKLFKTLCSEPRPVRQPLSESRRYGENCRKDVDFHPQGPEGSDPQQMKQNSPPSRFFF